MDCSLEYKKFSNFDNIGNVTSFKIKYKKRVQQRTQELFKKFDYNEKII